MDTKSRKFDRTWITKTIAFLLAVGLAAFACVHTLQQAQTLYQTVDGAGIYAEDVLRGIGKDDITRMTAFANENRTVQSLALQRFLYGDGSEKAYETYLKNQNAGEDTIRNKNVQAVLQNCLGFSGHGSPVALQRYLRDGVITLQKIADHPKHFVQGNIYVSDDYYSYEDADGNDYDHDTNWIYEESEAYDDDVNPTSNLVTEPQRYYGSDAAYDLQSSFDIPSSVTKQLKDGQVAVELCRTYIESGRIGIETYDGYYALTVNERAVEALYSNPNTNYTVSFTSYADFRNAYETAKKQAAAYKNLQFAVVDKATGKAVSNVAALDGKTLTKDDLQRFTKAKWNYSVDLFTGARTFSEAAQKDIDSRSWLRGTFTLFLTEGEVNGTLYAAFDQSLAAKDAFRGLVTEYCTVYDTIVSTVKLDLICLAGILLCVIYLVIRAGRRHDDDELHMLPLDRIFTLLRTAISFAAAAGFVALIVWFVDEAMTSWEVASPLENAFIGFFAAGAAACLLNWLQYVVRHIKGHTLFKNLFLVWLLLKLRDRRKAAQDKKSPVEYADLHKEVKRRVLRLGFLPNAMLGILAVIFMGCDVWFLAVLTLLAILGYNIWLAVYATRYAYRVRAGIEAVHRIRGGDYDVHLAVDETSPALAGFARDVNSINDGLHIAVSNAIKDERMRAELITNVSHDLKTPLTSIINYVDLLSRCEIEDETARQYLAVLTEKSARLKKLIEDLVEASKASSGAMRVDLVDMSLRELTNQIVGEYDDAFTERNLELIYTAEQDVLVRADSKLSYRVLDNLMSNVKKYAMPGTRVYLDLTETETHGVLTLRNVSQTQLHIPVEELLERFVRADESRSTEGSGLGLSIADNLCRLQGAELHLSISGDLFTAEVFFPKA